MFRLLCRKTEDDNTAGEAYFQADKAFLESMVAQRNLELDGSYMVLSDDLCGLKARPMYLI